MNRDSASQDKRRALQRALERRLPEWLSAQQILDRCVTLGPSGLDLLLAPPRGGFSSGRVLHRITFDSSTSSTSLKPSNIRFDFKIFLGFAANSYLTAGGATGNQFMALAAVASVVLSAVVLATAELTERETIVLLALHERVGYAAVRTADVASHVRAICEQKGLEVPTDRAIAAAIQRLTELRCLEVPYLGALRVAEAISTPFEPE